MSHSPPAAYDSPLLADFSEERLDAVVELADATRKLTDQLSRTQQTFDVYESTLLCTEPEMMQLLQ